MNGAAGTIFTFAFSWLRGILNGVWSLLSGAGGWLVSFLSNNWLVVLLVLLIGGFVVDRLVYIFRWRPYYLWRRKEKREKREPYEAYDEGALPERIDDGAAADAYSPYERQYTEDYDALYDEAYDEAYDPYAAQTRRVPAAPIADGYGDTIVAQGGGYERAGRTHQPFTRVDAPVNPESESMQHLVRDVPGTFGSAKPEPMYYQDMQMGYAPQLPPEQLYSPPPEAQAASPEPVHPGLDDSVFQQSMGLDERGAPEEKRTLFPDSTFVPYYQRRDKDAGQKPVSGLRQLARRASLIPDDDDKNAPSIHDLQPAKDLRSAFHAPVYPKNYQRPEE